MKTYAIASGSKLVFSVDFAPWETVTFHQTDFQNTDQATAEELAAVLNHSGSLACGTDAEGALVLASASQGDAASLEIDLAGSTAASALGLGARGALAHGTGLSAARLIGQTTQPFALPTDANMTIGVDGTKSLVVFDGLGAAARADQVVEAIDAQLPGVARARRDGRVMLVSPTAGPASVLEVEPGERSHGEADAAAILGFTGMSAFSRPASSDSARLVCSGKMPGLRLQNLTAAPIEMHLSAGSVLLPARGSIAIGPADAGHGPLQRMIARGIVRLAQED
jgi:hypothetical protein